MRTPLLLLAAVTLSLTAASAHAAPPAPDDAAALAALARAADAAWDAADAKRMAALYGPEASLLVNGAGSIREGRGAVSAYFASSFAARPGAMRHVTELRQLDMLSADLALTDAAVRVEARQADGEWKVLRRFHTISVAERTAGGWRLRVVRAFPLG
jgi:uncharacterized protein (TIGR02246 family)